MKRKEMLWQSRRKTGEDYKKMWAANVFWVALFWINIELKRNYKSNRLQLKQCQGICFQIFFFFIFFFYWLEQLFLQESTVKELLKQRGKRNNNKQKIYSRQGAAEMRGWEINGRGRIWQPTVCNQHQVLQNLEDVCFTRQWFPAPGLCLVIYGSWQLLQRLNKEQQRQKSVSHPWCLPVVS